MSERRLRAAVAAFALAGAGVAGYLTWVRYAGGALFCSTGGCETVQSSSYAELFGVPVAALGAAAYLLIGATALFRATPARAAGALLALAGLAFSTYLVVVQLAVIGAVCDWCLASDTIMTALAAATLLRLWESRNLIQPHP